MSREARVPALDGVRGVAILLVMVHHFVAYPGHEALLGKRPFALAYAGWIGVDLFFVLSGFLITGLLLQAKGSQHYFRNFYMRRVLRIFPLYYGVLLVLFGLLPLLYRYTPAIRELADRQLWLWLYGVNVHIAVHRTWLFTADWLELGHFWSLAVEEQFYLLWPALVFVLSHRRLVQLCALLVPLALIARIGMLAAGVDPGGVYVLTVSRMDSLAIGALLAIAVRSPNGVVPLLRSARWTAGASAAVLLAIFLPQGRFQEDLVAVQTVGYPLLALLFGSLLILALDPAPTSWAKRLFSSGVLCMLGTYSYGLYVFHVLLRPLWLRLFGVPRLLTLLPSPRTAVFVFAVLAIGGSLGVAALSWHLYEKHFLRLKRRFEFDRVSARPANEAPGESLAVAVPEG